MRILPFAVCALLIFPACGGAEEPDEVVSAAPEEQSNTLADLKYDEAGLTVFHTALVHAGYMDDLRSRGPFTIFAPTDSAFYRMSGTSIQDLLTSQDREQLREILSLHIVDGPNVTSREITGTRRFTSALGQIISVSAFPDRMAVSDGHGNAFDILTPDIRADNGVVHIIDGVLRPLEVGQQSVMGEDGGEEASDQEEIIED